MQPLEERKISSDRNWTKQVVYAQAAPAKWRFQVHGNLEIYPESGKLLNCGGSVKGKLLENQLVPFRDCQLKARCTALVLETVGVPDYGNVLRY